MRNHSTCYLNLLILFTVGVTAFSAPTCVAQPSAAVLKSKNIEITEAMLDGALEIVPAEDRAGIAAAPKRIAEMLKGMLITKTLVKEAQESGLANSTQIMAEIAAARESIIAKAWLKEFEKQIVPPKYENTAREQYITQAEKYTVPADLDTSHILFKTQCRTEAEALRLAIQVQEKIASGKSFEEAAIEFSEDNSVKKNNGNLGTLPENALAKKYSEAAKMLKVGEISKPIISEFGVHLIKLNKIAHARKITFDEAKAGIIAELEFKYKATQRSKKLAEIEFDPSVELNSALLLKRGARTTSR